jgi:hypothetical protein
MLGLRLAELNMRNRECLSSLLCSMRTRSLSRLCVQMRSLLLLCVWTCSNAFLGIVSLFWPLVCSMSRPSHFSPVFQGSTIHPTTILKFLCYTFRITSCSTSSHIGCGHGHLRLRLRRVSTTTLFTHLPMSNKPDSCICKVVFARICSCSLPCSTCSPSWMYSSVVSSRDIWLHGHNDHV